MLPREEYIEQAYFFRGFRERIDNGVPSQDIFDTLAEEILATTKLPMAIQFLKGEILHQGTMGKGMSLLGHYFSPFQAFVITRSEDNSSKFEQRIALQILERQAEYLADKPTPAGLFIFQFECLARNRLGYDFGMEAIAADPMYNDDWKTWIGKVRLQLGMTEFADLIYFRSETYLEERRRRMGDPTLAPSNPVLFGAQEGRIAKANRGKDPLYMFAALQRQIGHPAAPRSPPRSSAPLFHPALEARLHRLESRLQLLEAETKGELDLTRFLKRDDSANGPTFGGGPM